MENQHTLIKGYRSLSQTEINLMNKVKGLGELLELAINDVNTHLINARFKAKLDNTDGRDELIRIEAAQPERWAAIARTHLQEGLMALTRAVAQPESF